MGASLSKILLNLTSGMAMMLLISCHTTEQWNIADYGAQGDSITLNTQAIQKAIDTCAAQGGGRVVVPRGVFVTGTLLLRNGVELHLTEGAMLLGSRNPMDYRSIDTFTDAVGQKRGKCLIGALGVKQVSITGKGLIYGAGEYFRSDSILKFMQQEGIADSLQGEYLSNRPFLLRFVQSTNIHVSGVHLEQAAAWTCHFYQCKGIVVDGISIYSHAHHNNDGIDLDSSEDALITHCTIDSGDDAICFKTTSPAATRNVMVNACQLKSDWGAIKFGTESMGNFENIVVKNCFIYDTRGGGIKILSVDGANISNVLIDSITMVNTEMPVFVRLGSRLRTYRNAPRQQEGNIQGVTLRNITAEVRDTGNCRVNPPSGILITGLPEQHITSLTLENIHITLPGGGAKIHSKRVVAEDETRYPEFSFFGVLPAYGIYARHVQSLDISGLNIELRNPDERPRELFLDVVSLKEN